MVYTKIPPPPGISTIVIRGNKYEKGNVKRGGILKKKEERGKTKRKLEYTEKFEADYSIFSHHVNLQENVSTLHAPTAQYIYNKQI
jgi:hypothetical protein